MVFRKIIAVYCYDHIEYTGTVHGQSTEIFNVKTRGTYSNHRPFNKG
jgi:hypothetical protein